MRFILTTALGVLAAGVLAAATPGVAFAAASQCDLALDKTAVGNTTVQTKSTTPINLNGAVVGIVQGPPNCLIVEFSAQVHAPKGMNVRLTRDGFPIGTPDSATFVSSDNFDTRTVKFFVPTDAGNAGSHTYRIQFESADGTLVSLGKFILTVYYSANVM